MKIIVHILIIQFLTQFISFGLKKPKSDFKKNDEATAIFVIGDWGRKGQQKQKELGEMMGKIGEKIEPEFVISTGDNFYPNGVASTFDPQWYSSFENIYTNQSLNCDWYVVLGNHDYRGSIEAEIDYSNISRRWNMPEQYFSFEMELEDGSIALFAFMDTSPLNNEYYDDKKYQENVSKQDTTAQLQWLRKTLKESKADWKIVTGHHPLYTGGKRISDENSVRRHVEKILLENNVDLYLAGHEHDLQHIKPQGSVHHIISGAGSEVRKTGMLPFSKFAASIQGFSMLELSKNSLRVKFINYEGKIIYEYDILK